MVKACKLFHLTEDFSVDTASTDNASVAVMCVAYWKKKKIPRAVLLRPNDILLERGVAHEKKIYLLLNWWCFVTSF